MYKIRSKFYKKEDMIFISHLDLVRIFERAFRRAYIPISYTQGFNPHPIMAFATALGVGISSESEYIDIELNEKIDLIEFMDRLNNQLPKGLKIIKSQYISKDEVSLMATIQYSSYVVKVNLTEKINEKELKCKLKSFLELKEIKDLKTIKKKKGFKKTNKNHIKEINIRPLIKELSLIKKENNEVLLMMLLSAGSSGNLKPETVVKKFQEEMRISINLEKVRVNRLELFKEIEPQPLTPLDNINDGL